MIVIGQAIARRGCAACLDRVEGLGRTEEAASIDDAWANPALAEVDVVVLDVDLDGAAEFVVELLEFTATRVLALGSRRDPGGLAAVLERGASAGLEIDALTAEGLVAAVRATGAGAPLLEARPSWSGMPIHVPVPAQLSEREQGVLRLVAAGMPTREVALELHYSERTVKKVLSDVVVKLGARSRSHAIASAVRQGII
ncbi:MAG TPA: LuxR C-terminal-related transcriptional regulator [Solirubrobacteraceae bacterium]|nr:LuxR C-terminal-related transcriptional regulator [Solirubrobacteraceae bacterium]